MLASESSTREAQADIQAALRGGTVDLRLTQCQLVNVYSGEICRTQIAIRGRRIVAIRSEFDGEAGQTIDCRNQYVIPGYIEPRAVLGEGGRPSRGLSAPGVTSVISRAGDEFGDAGSRPAGPVPHHFQEARAIGAPLAGGPTVVRVVHRIQRDCVTQVQDELIQAMREGRAVIVDIPADAGERHALLSVASRLGEGSQQSHHSPVWAGPSRRWPLRVSGPAGGRTWRCRGGADDVSQRRHSLWN